MASGEAIPSQRFQSALRGLLLLLAVCLFAAVCTGLLGIVDTRTSARRSACSIGLQNITLALIQYHDAHGSFPPPYIADAEGKPMHSWRVLLLPYLDQRPLYKQYRFDEPWDGPNNLQLHGIVLKLYSCPSRSPNQSATDTSYVAVIRPMFRANSTVRMADLKDGSSNTILLVEVQNSGIHWLEPRDLDVSQMPMSVNPPTGIGISSDHPGGAHVSFADGSVRFLSNETPPATLRALLTGSGKEPPGDLPNSKH
jgi:prepilin-type processing-associated H-X9-DG protein